MTRAARRRILLVGALVPLLAYQVARAWPEQQGCEAYTPSAAPLVAHAGGGLPGAFYTNSRAALDRSAAAGFALIEIDFTASDGRLALWHEGHPESDMRLDDLVDWLRDHPGIRIVTDVKSDNLAGLREIRRAAGAMQHRFIPQIYHPDQFGAVRALGYRDVILTVYNLPEDDRSWIGAANALDLMAVTMPADRRALASRVDHFVYLHTVNEPLEGYGLYTDCLVPEGGAPANRALTMLG